MAGRSGWQAGAVLLVVLSLALVGCTGTEGQSPVNGTYGRAAFVSATPPASVPAEAQFMDEFIERLNRVIDPSYQIQRQTERPELQQLSVDIVAQNHARIAELQRLRLELFPDLNSSVFVGPRQKGELQMTISADENVQPDLRYLNGVIASYENAIGHAQGGRANIQNAGLQTLVDNFLATAQPELDLLKQYRQEWYNQ